ncbi:MAG: hypothetical protein U9N59_05030 [Campylobacterota bacterium]|nr:hypothetical protein [Campylobacterota bacterium]
MIRTLDNLVLLKEVMKVSDNSISRFHLEKKHPNKVIVVKKNSFVYKDIIDNEVASKTTDLSNYLLITELADSLLIDKKTILQRIYFMEKTGIKLFDFIKVCDIYFIKVCDKFKALIQQYQAYLVSLKDTRVYKDFYLLGDLKVGFY